MECSGLGAFTHATIGVRSLDEATRFWETTFGFEVTARRDGPDATLATAWDISPADIARQAIIATPGAGAGAMHLVEFASPAPPVRLGAMPYDLLPKNLDLYTEDMPTRYVDMAQAGHRFRSGWVEMPGPDGLRFREVHMHGHDEINVVLLEVIGPGYEPKLNHRHFSGIGPLVAIVPDSNAEAGFWADVLGMDTTLELLLAGPDIERAVGLPPGAGLDLKVFGDSTEPLGRIEVIEYQQVRGENLYSRARPPATGILHVNYCVDDVAPVKACLARAGIASTCHGRVSTLYGTGVLLSLHAPAGLRIEILGKR